MLVHGDQKAQREGGNMLEENRSGGAIPFEHLQHKGRKAHRPIGTKGHTHKPHGHKGGITIEKDTGPEVKHATNA